MTERPGARGGLLFVAALVLAPAAAALLGSASGRPLLLNLGPGDSPFIEGFTPSYEIEDKVATHWSRERAAIRLPLALRGGARLAYRFARVLPETAQVEVRFEGRTVDRFSCRGGTWLERQAPVAGAGAAPIEVAIAVDSHDRQRLGLKMDLVRIEPARGSRLFLAGAARWRAAVLVALALLLLRLSGWGHRGAAALCLPLCAGLVFGLLVDPWLTHRLLWGVPELLAGAGGLGVAVGLWLRERGRAGATALRTVTALALFAFLARAAAVNHPAFYYPDLRTHARLVETVAGAGLDFFVSPAKHIWEHGVWRTEAYGRTYAFPYTPAFHLPFVPLGLPYDTLIAAMKLWAAALSVVPLVLLWPLARRTGACLAGVGLMAVVPTYTSRLSFAFLPALFGHALDVALLLWLCGRLDRLSDPRVLLRGAALVCAAQLAYVSGVINTGVLLAALAAAAAAFPPPGGTRWGLAVRVLAMGLAGSALSLVLYYRDFLPMVLEVLPRIGGGAAGAASRYPVQGFLEVAQARTHDFFDGVYPWLALAGLAGLLRRGRARPVLLAWLAAYFGLLLGRAKAPDLFLHGHETLLATPLVCLASGQALGTLWGRGGWGRLLALLAAAFLAVQGAWLQWRALGEQLKNAL